MVTKQDLLDLHFVESCKDKHSNFFDLNNDGNGVRYFYRVNNGLFKNNMLCFLKRSGTVGYFDHSQGYIISSKAQLKKILKLHGL